MKMYNVLSLIMFFGLSFGVQAQFDDLYYNPDEAIATDYEDGDYSEYDYDDESYNEDDYEDYEYWAEYDNNYYTNQINRSRRNTSRLVWLNSWAANSFYCSPYDFYTPYNTNYRGGSFININIGNPIGYARYSRFNRFGNVFNPYYSYNPFRTNSFGRNSFGRGGFGGINTGYNPYCPPASVNNNIRNRNASSRLGTNNPNGSYYGSRRTGTNYGNRATVTNPRRSSQTVRTNRGTNNSVRSTNPSSRSLNSARRTAPSTRSTTRSSRPSTSSRSTTRSSRPSFNNNSTRRNSSRFNSSRSNTSSRSFNSSRSSSTRAGSSRSSSSRSSSVSRRRG
jgi:hypothetical protein